MLNKTAATTFSLIPSSSFPHVNRKPPLLAYPPYTKSVKLSQQKNRTRKAKNPSFPQKPQYSPKKSPCYQKNIYD
jgi:hypothetical protein